MIISSDLKLRLDGLPKSGQCAPADPGVAVYFTLNDQSQCVPVDSYFDVAQNLAAVAAVLSAFRALERHGSGLMQSAFTGFQALPDPSRNEHPHWTVLFNSSSETSYDAVRANYRKLCSRHHPDKDGDAVMFDQVQKAWNQFKQEEGY